MTRLQEGTPDRASLDRLFAESRPKLHRYCARMTGSVIDGEDVLQDALAKAVEAVATGAAIGNPQAWLFRIAHNAALDFLRRRARNEAVRSDEDPDMIADPENQLAQRIAAAAGMRTFMRLPVAQRSAVVLMDVLGYSLDEIAAILDTSVASVKATLHRGRARLREMAGEPDDRPLPTLGEPQRSLLAAYVDRFNARDFVAVRDMLAEEVRLELVARTRMSGKREVGTYLGNYERTPGWLMRPGFVEGRPAIIGSECADPAKPTYFVLLEWRDDKVLAIRDFRHARYAVEGAEVAVLD